MPELPDIVVYLDALERTIVGRRLEAVVLSSPFVLRSVDPPLFDAEGKTVRAVNRLGKRLVWRLDDELSLVLHLMIAGRLRWSDQPRAKPPGKIGLAVFRFPDGAVLFTEASPKKRASLHLVRGEAALAEHRRAGLDVLDADRDAFAHRLTAENHTLKRALTDPRLFDGIGNAYSDEILHAARLSPVKLTAKLSDDEVTQLHRAARDTLTHWIDVLRDQFKDRFPGPGDITAFRPDFAAHGKFQQPCPVCSTPIQRIRYAENETNYCPTCQTGGKLLADRSLSRLLKSDWPRSIEELEGGPGGQVAGRQ